MAGSSISRPPKSEPFAFIHAGWPHGDAITLRSGLSSSARRSSGRICASSCAMLKRVIS